MKKHVEKDFLRSLLFENNINEIFQLDGDMDAMKTNSTIYDRPGPNIGGLKEMEPEDILELPLTADDMMATQLADVKVNSEKLSGEDYVPNNQKELVKAISSLLQDVSLTEKETETFWRATSKYLNKRI